MFVDVPGVSSKTEEAMEVDSVCSEVPSIPSNTNTCVVEFIGTAGPYKGYVFELQLKYKPRSKRSCPIGRSGAKKYLSPKGISLPFDNEVSTAHAEVG